jgi:hypothetical protein
MRVGDQVSACQILLVSTTGALRTFHPGRTDSRPNTIGRVQGSKRVAPDAHRGHIRGHIARHDTLVRMTHAAHESARDIADVPALEVVSTAAVHLMSAAAVQLGLAEDLPDHKDLDEARTLIEALAGLVVAGAPRLGHHHAAPLRDGLRTLQLAFREASDIPDAPGEGPGEKLTGPVSPTRSGH